MTHGLMNLPEDPGSRGTHCEHDALADLFLEDTTPSPQPVAPKIRLAGTEADSACACGVEVLLLGHLPVLGSAWVGPYASMRAERLCGPVGLVRLLGGDLSIDVVCAGGAARPAVSGSTQVDRAISEAGETVRGWLVRADSVQEASLLASPGIERITLLTGSDEPALVSAYARLKTLAELLASRPEVRIGVAVMGVDATKAAAVVRRLRESAAAFLKRDIDDASSLERIGVCPMAGAYLGAYEGDVASLVQRLARSADEPVARPAPIRAETPEVVVRMNPVKPAPVREPDPVRTPPRSVPSMPGAPTGGAQLELAGKIGGLVSLGRLCPTAPGVEVATDRDGKIHLVAGSIGGDQEHGKSLEGLLSAAGWAFSHGSLLEKISPGLKPGEPTLHLVTDHAPRVRPLLDSVLRVHLMTGPGGQTLVELN